MALDVYKDWLGIPDGPRPPDHYSLLRLVQFEDDVEKVRKNYKKLNAHVRKYATGQYSTQSQELLNELAKAMLCLTDVDRKNDYDRSLGREIDDRDRETGRRPLTAFLAEWGVITHGQAGEVKAYCEKTGLSARDAVVQMKFASQEDAAKALAAEFGRSYIDLTEVLPDDSVLDQMPRAVVRRHTCLPLFLEDDAVLVAVADEPSHELEDEIRLRFGLPLRAVIATPLAINQGIAKYYAAGLRKESAEPVAKGKGTSSAKSNKAAKAAAPELSADEKQERKKLGIVLCNFTIAMCALLDTMVLWDRVWKFFLPGVLSWTPFVLTLLLGVPVCLVLFQTMIRPGLK